jgi:L-glutamine:2-deoxy-scyllo-inosose/3-amino-2,3-dideoxy-scyllo-inosose aminotransferase
VTIVTSTEQARAGSGSPVVLGGVARPAIAAAPWPRPAGREMELLGQVVNSGIWGFDGPLEAEFERSFAAYQNAEFGLCVANGTVALQLALEALDVGAGDEVIVPGVTWQATAAAALDINAVPVLADIEPGTYCVDPDEVERLITPRTRAIIVVHLYGSLADLDRICEIGARHQIPVIEDCAHAHGSRWRDRGTGSLGTLGCFSFQLFKTLSAGEGGFVTTNDPALREAIYSLRNCGRRRAGSLDENWRPIQSGNYRMTEFQAAVLLAQFDVFDEQAEQRNRNAIRLEASLAELPGVAPMDAPPQRTRISPYEFAFKFCPDEWDGVSAQAFRAALAAELGIEVDRINEPLNAAPLYQPHTKRRYQLSDGYWDSVNPARFDLPVARSAYRDGVTLPHKVLLDDEAAPAIADAIARLHQHRQPLAHWTSTGS